MSQQIARIANVKVWQRTLEEEIKIGAVDLSFREVDYLRFFKMDCRHIQFRETPVDLQQLQTLFQAAAFWARNRQMEDMAIAIANSDPVITVWDGDRMIGFARATSDGIYRATIWDVVIHPDFQGAGLGRKLVETVLSHPKLCRVERVYLMTTHQQRFYERIGFEANGTTTMVLHNRPLMDTASLWLATSREE